VATIRAVEQQALFGAAEVEGTHRESEPRATREAQSGTGSATPQGAHEADQRSLQQTTFRAVSPLSNTPLGDVCAHCGNEIQPPGFVIRDYEELGAFCNETCGDRRFRLFLEEPSD
jgi:hypothetical protein